MATLAATANELSAKVTSLEDQLAPKFSDLLNASERLNEAASTVAESWSGSALGYHSELHYRDFQKPSFHARFDPEWGGINGLPDGWEARTPDEVKERIERLAGANITALESETEAALERVKELQAEIVTELSLLHSQNGYERERALLVAIEKYEWGRRSAITCKGTFRPAL